jgi:Mg2+ and Co2+ transporter CorA
MPVAEETHRNKLIAKLYKPHSHGYKKLGKEFKLHWTTVKEIVKREEERQKVREKKLGLD